VSASAPRGWVTVIAMAFAGIPATVSCMFAVSPLQMRFRTPRRANARRSSSSVASSPNSARFSPDTARLTDPRRANVQGSRLFFGRRRTKPGIYQSLTIPVTHGGLTPAAPGAIAFVCRKSRNFRQTLALQGTRAGGVSPPWLGDRDCNRSSCFQGKGGVFPSAPRGWLIVIAIEAPASKEKEACLRQPPWLGDRDCNGVRRHTGDGLVHVCRIALANAFSHTTAG